MTTVDEIAAATIASHKDTITFDAGIYREALALYCSVAPSVYVPHATTLLSGPDVKERLAITATLRALGNSALLSTLIPGAVTVARLYYLTAFLEGVVKPQLQVLVALGAQRGLLPAGPKAKQELENAREKLGPALSYLGGAGAAMFASSPLVPTELQWADGDKLARFRNAVAHFRFRLIEPTVPADDLPAVKVLGQSRSQMIMGILGSLAKLLGLPAFEASKMPDYENSFVQYNENLGVLNGTSRRRSYPEIRTILDRVERLGFSLLVAFVDAGTSQQRDGQLRLGQCGVCKEGMQAGLPRATVTCPVCSNVWTFN